MKYIVDCEFIDTPKCSALISIAVLREDGEYVYCEFKFPEQHLTQWLVDNVLPHLRREMRVTFSEAAKLIADLVEGDDKAEFWAYYGAYDWYWLNRLFGGFMNAPLPMLYHEYAHVETGFTMLGREHHALDDVISQSAAMQAKGMWNHGVRRGRG